MTAPGIGQGREPWYRGLFRELRAVGADLWHFVLCCCVAFLIIAPADHLSTFEQGGLLGIGLWLITKREA